MTFRCGHVEYTGHYLAVQHSRPTAIRQCPTVVRQRSDRSPTEVRQSDTVYRPSLSNSSDSVRQWSDRGPTEVRQSDSPTVRHWSDSVRQPSDSVQQCPTAPTARALGLWRHPLFSYSRLPPTFRYSTYMPASSLAAL